MELSDFAVSAVLAVLLAAAFAGLIALISSYLHAAEAQAARAEVLAGALKAGDGYWYAVVVQVGGWRPFKFITASGQVNPPQPVYCERQFYIAPSYLCVYRLTQQPLGVVPST